MSQQIALSHQEVVLLRKCILTTVNVGQALLNDWEKSKLADVDTTLLKLQQGEEMPDAYRSVDLADKNP